MTRNHSEIVHVCIMEGGLEIAKLGTLPDTIATALAQGNADAAISAARTYLTDVSSKPERLYDTLYKQIELWLELVRSIEAVVIMSFEWHMQLWFDYVEELYASANLPPLTRESIMSRSPFPW